MNQIYNNVVSLYTKYGSDKIKTDRHLLLLYWRNIDLLKIDKTNIDTKDFLNKSTNITAIIQCSNMYKIVKEGEING